MVNLYSLALAQVIAYIEDRWVSVSTPVVFKFSELNKLYCEQLVRHKIYVSHGRDVLLTFEQHIGMALQQVTEHTDSDVIRLMHAAKLLRSHIISSSYGSLTGSDKAVPPVLSNFVTMLLAGPECLMSLVIFAVKLHCLCHSLLCLMPLSIDNSFFSSTWKCAICR